MMAVDAVCCAMRLRDQLAVAGRAGDEAAPRPGIRKRKPVDRLSSTTTALAGVDQLMHHVAADIAGAARDQDRHDLAPRMPRTSYRAAVKERLGRRNAAMVMAVMLNAAVYDRRQRQHGRYSFHQDVVARGCDPPHAGADRGARGAPGRALYLAGGGGLRAAGAAASGGRRGHSGGLAALAQVALCAGDAGARSPAACAPSARSATTRSSTARACCARR